MRVSFAKPISKNGICELVEHKTHLIYLNVRVLACGWPESFPKFFERKN